MSIVVKTLACGSLINANNSNTNNTKSLRAKQSTGGIMPMKKGKVSDVYSSNRRIRICTVCVIFLLCMMYYTEKKILKLILINSLLIEGHCCIYFRSHHKQYLIHRSF